jgi:hypothetical protein
MAGVGSEGDIKDIAQIRFNLRQIYVSTCGGILATVSRPQFFLSYPYAPTHVQVVTNQERISFLGGLWGTRT